MVISISWHRKRRQTLSLADCLLMWFFPFSLTALAWSTSFPSPSPSLTYLSYLCISGYLFLFFLFVTLFQQLHNPKLPGSVLSPQQQAPTLRAEGPRLAAPGAAPRPLLSPPGTRQRGPPQPRPSSGPAPRPSAAGRRGGAERARCRVSEAGEVAAAARGARRGGKEQSVARCSPCSGSAPPLPARGFVPQRGAARPGGGNRCGGRAGCWQGPARRGEEAAAAVPAR